MTIARRSSARSTIRGGSPATFNGYGPRLHFNRDQLALSHTWRLGGGRLESSLTRNRTATIRRTLPSGTPGGLPGSGAPNKPAGAARTLEPISDVLDTLFVTLQGRHLLTVGGQYWDTEMIDGVAPEPFAQTQWSLFAEDQWVLASSLALTVGTRHDQHDAFGGHTSPRAYLVWTARPTITVKGGVSGGYKTPRLDQLVDGITGFVAQARTALMGTPGLRPETSLSTELGVYVDRGNGTERSVSFFNNDFRDKITSGTPVPNCTFAGAPNLPDCRTHGSFPTQESFSQSVNVDRAVTRGVELSARTRLRDRWSASGNCTGTASEQLSGPNANFPLANTPRHMANAQLRCDIGSRVQTWVSGEYRSSRARRLTGAANPAWDALGDFRAYGLMHLGGSATVHRGLTLRATIFNLLDTDSLRFASYQGATSSANPTGVMYTNVYNNHQEGRRLWLSTP